MALETAPDDNPQHLALRACFPVVNPRRPGGCRSLQKAIPIGELVKTVTARPAAQDANRTWNASCLERLNEERASLHDIAYRLLSKFKTGLEFWSIGRPMSRGHLHFKQGHDSPSRPRSGSRTGNSSGSAKRKERRPAHSRTS